MKTTRVSPATVNKRKKAAMEALTDLGFEPKQANDLAGLVLLALLDLPPDRDWPCAVAPLRGITPIIEFIRQHYAVNYAPNTRETVRDEVVKHFVERGMVLRNPDDPGRPTNSGKTVYQIEPTALNLFRTFESLDWYARLADYNKAREQIRHEIQRHRELRRIQVVLPDGSPCFLSPGGQNPLVKAIIEEFCQRFTPGGVVLYVGDTESKFRQYNSEYLAGLGVRLDAAAKMPDVVVHDVQRNWLVLVEAVTSAGPVDGKRRKELKDLFAGFPYGLVFVTAFPDREGYLRFAKVLSWETEVWIADQPDHMMHLNGERYLGPYPDTVRA